MPPILYLADQVQDVRFDRESKAFLPAADVADGPTFTIGALTYFQAQEYLVDGIKPAEQVRIILRHGVRAIDGDPAAAAAFVERPRARLCNPLSLAIQDLTWGN